MSAETDLSNWAECHDHGTTFPMGEKCPKCTLPSKQKSRPDSVFVEGARYIREDVVNAQIEWLKRELAKKDGVTVETETPQERITRLREPPHCSTCYCGEYLDLPSEKTNGNQAEAHDLPRDHEGPHMSSSSPRSGEHG
jgi:hypothetical protein